MFFLRLFEKTSYQESEQEQSSSERVAAMATSKAAVLLRVLRCGVFTLEIPESTSVTMGRYHQEGSNKASNCERD